MAIGAAQACRCGTRRTTHGGNTFRYTRAVFEEFRWPDGGAILRDGLTPTDVIDALYAPRSLRMDNRVPARAPTFMAVCGPTDDHRLIVVSCVRASAAETWTIVGARAATDRERAMWRKYTS